MHHKEQRVSRGLARCAPIARTNAVNDDNVWNPPNYNVTLLGTKKLLMNVMDPAKAYSPKGYVGIGDPEAGSFPGWPRRDMATGNCADST